MIDILSIKAKVAAACAATGTTITDLAKYMGVTQPTFSQRLKIGKFSQEELEKIGKFFGAEYRSGFYFPDGSKIE